MTEQNQADPPFFDYLSHKGVHDNFSAEKSHIDCYKDKELVLPPNFNTPHYGIKELPTIDKKTGKAAFGKEYYGEKMAPDWGKSQEKVGMGWTIPTMAVLGMFKFANIVRPCVLWMKVSVLSWII